MVEISDKALSEAKQRWRDEREGRVLPLSVRFDVASERIVVDFTNGAAFVIPARALEGLSDASIAELSEVTLLGETGIHFESRDVDFSIAGLMSGIFGTRAFMEAQRRGGSSRSPAKIAASRANGAKGGRPRKEV